MRIIVVDDEQNVITMLKSLLERYYPDMKVCGEAGSVKEAMKILEQEQPDLLLLDIKMPDGNGFDVLKNIQNISFQVIFVTAYNQYALDAIKHSAVDYLLKPIDIDEFRKAIDKARLNHKKGNKNINSLLANLKEIAAPNKIAIPTVEGLEFVNSNDILYCQADGHYTRFELLKNETIISSKNIGEYEEMLPSASFCRIHNSYLINLRHIRRYIKGKGGSVIMDNGKEIEVSVRKKDTFLEIFRNKNV